MIFIPFIKNKEDIKQYSGFIFRCIKKDNNFFIARKNDNSDLQFVPEEIVNESLILEENEIRVSAIDNKGNIIYLHNGIAFKGTKNSIKRLYGKEIIFKKEQILCETDFVENLFGYYYSLAFVENNLSVYKDILNDDFESYENYVFAHYYIPRFIYALYKLYSTKELLIDDIKKHLVYLRDDSKINVTFNNVGDYLYYLSKIKNKKINFNEFKRITMNFLS